MHNRHVVEDLRAKGAVFVDELDEVPDDATVIFSAHGISPEVRAEAQGRGLHVIDATCPLVTKVHLEAIRYAREGYTIILIGHADHDEVIGTLGEAPDRMVVIDPPRGRGPGGPQSREGRLLTQTTLSVDDTREVIEALRGEFPRIVGPSRDDICYATQNRQAAVKNIAGEVDVVLVIGATNSSNANRLVEVAETVGTRAYLINDLQDIRSEWLQGAAHRRHRRRLHPGGPGDRSDGRPPSRRGRLREVAGRGRGCPLRPAPGAGAARRQRGVQCRTAPRRASPCSRPPTPRRGRQEEAR